MNQNLCTATKFDWKRDPTKPITARLELQALQNGSAKYVWEATVCDEEDLVRKRFLQSNTHIHLNSLRPYLVFNLCCLKFINASRLFIMVDVHDKHFPSDMSCLIFASASVCIVVDVHDKCFPFDMSCLIFINASELCIMTDVINR
mmetsp:Transcript_117656/g.333445  ORF Transcript_117656/g.333445 Transcript_117656/m.333445 type:complete len:146 (+) Transcript_117656:537-974(+)